MTALEAWIFTMMISILSPATKAKARHLDPYDVWADYADTAFCMADVLRTEPLLFRGDGAEIKTAAVLLAIAKHETAFTNDISGDGGRSHCMMAIMTGRTGRVREGTGEQLKHDKYACIQAGLRVARTSFRVCSRNPLLERLNVYASGSCDRGRLPSRNRMAEAVRLWNATPPLPDSYEDENERLTRFIAD
jgi:hypothetical protein